MPLWRNWLARSAVNRKVGGSSPPRGGFLVYFSCPHFYFYPILSLFLSSTEMEWNMNTAWKDGDGDGYSTRTEHDQLFALFGHR